MAIDKRQNDVIAEFKRKRARQISAIVVVIFLLAALLWKTGHPGFLTGVLSKSVATVLEIAVIAGFVLFSGINWRCPACDRSLGADIDRRECRKCGTRFS